MSQFAFGQKAVGSYLHHIELGAISGRLNNSIRLDYSIQSFHGIQLDQKNKLGFFVGFDSYPKQVLMPLGFGWRSSLNPNRRNSLNIGLDLGYGSSWLDRKEIEGVFEKWNEGGVMLSPLVGIVRKSKNGTMAYTWNLGFRKQFASTFEGVRSSGLSTIEGIRPGYDSIFEESYVFNSLTLRWGILF
ncbi:hypothetical protein ACFOUP_12005 [Belliella kenyensis]|uniref:Outer membrane protein beta-barrel family protein n=1 Tax=Belliella kenyensis TaxID=1472724 RepID=A0ABV8EP56_9BACT|nr:hypothetical protein [Belliella kenyensis]MCH7400688.1 hypothetical protein [Belliella kenyensis]MDN3602025.1 hypothetical protein [Belliella kenyensis]